LIQSSSDQTSSESAERSHQSKISSSSASLQQKEYETYMTRPCSGDW